MLFPFVFEDVAQQTYWNNIALESDGPLEPSKGYSYGAMLDVWAAANATKSPVVMMWWRPEANLQEWEGTDGEFMSVTLPGPTEECRKGRVNNEERCTKDIWVRRGKKEGACGYEAHSLKKFVAAALGEHTYSTEPARRSPAYHAIKNLRISDLSMGTMLGSWVGRGVDRWGFDPR